jgi:hypothetical protein
MYNAFLQGYSMAEAAVLCQPNLAWKGIAIGDPLYQPFSAKAIVTDTQAPQFASGYPKTRWNNAQGTIVSAYLNTAVPEVVHATILYGIGTPSTAGNPILRGYYARPLFAFSDLQSSSTYTYTVTATDPAGHVTTSPHLTFTTQAQTSYLAQPPSIPGELLFWQFDNGGEGIAYHDTDPQNYLSTQPRADTGAEIFPDPIYGGVVEAFVGGEWMEYTVNVRQTGYYSISVYADLHGGSIAATLSEDGKLN